MSHNSTGSGWNPPVVPTPIQTIRIDDLEAMQFRGDNFLEVNAFLQGRGYRLGPDAMLVDAEDRAFLLWRNDYVVRWPNGTLSRHRPSQEPP